MHSYAYTSAHVWQNKKAPAATYQDQYVIFRKEKRMRQQSRTQKNIFLRTGGLSNYLKDILFYISSACAAQSSCPCNLLASAKTHH